MRKKCTTTSMFKSTSTEINRLLPPEIPFFEIILGNMTDRIKIQEYKIVLQKISENIMSNIVCYYTIVASQGAVWHIAATLLIISNYFRNDVYNRNIKNTSVQNCFIENFLYMMPKIGITMHLWYQRDISVHCWRCA